MVVTIRDTSWSVRVSVLMFNLMLCVYRAFGYSSEDVQMVIETMASQGKEPTFCMGDDIPLAVLSQKPHMLFDYFKQRFAQVRESFGHIILCLLARQSP